MLNRLGLHDTKQEWDMEEMGLQRKWRQPRRGRQIVSRKRRGTQGGGGSSVSRVESISRGGVTGVEHGRMPNQLKNQKESLVLVFRRQPRLVFNLIL